VRLVEFARASSATFRGQGASSWGADGGDRHHRSETARAANSSQRRLASLGTLRGMAHEIKNPLVSIKNFCSALTRAHQRSDFRENLFQLNRHEIDRIDRWSISSSVRTPGQNHLLRPMHVHEVWRNIANSFNIGVSKGDQTHPDVGGSLDTIRADSDQMEQVFLNFFLNAMMR